MLAARGGFDVASPDWLSIQEEDYDAKPLDRASDLSSDASVLTRVPVFHQRVQLILNTLESVLCIP